MNMLRLFGTFMIILVGVVGEFTDVGNGRLPRLFHLDDYERCLSQKYGLYCIGIFELTPIHPSPMSKLIKEYSSHPLAFNRSRLHRGYCVSERCPSRERNATVRFERCVSERAHRHALTARLHTLHHCTSHVQHTATPPHTHIYNQLTFIQIVAALLALNVLGTVYDVATGDDRKKISILMAWSAKTNWQHLTAKDDVDPRMKRLQLLNGMKVICGLGVLFVHVFMLNTKFFYLNLHYLENFLNDSFGLLLSNSSSLIQVFILISTFLVGYNLLIKSEKQKLSLTMLPRLVLKRFARLAPVHILVIGFFATWWPRIYFGPFHWQIEEQSVICRRKFWSHVFFYNNMVDKHSQCVVPTWFLPVDMHLYILSVTLVIVLQHWRQQARRFLALAFIISSVACGVVNYFTGWQAMTQYVTPDNVRGLFTNVESFGMFYTSTWGSMMACFLGLYMAYLYYDLRQIKYDFSKLKWVRFLHPWCLPFLAVWLLGLGSLARRYNNHLFNAFYTAVDRPAFVAIAFFYILGMLNFRGITRYILSWSGWRIPARLSLPVMLCHWLIANYVLARPFVYHISMFTVTVDFITVVVLVYIIAIPISLLIEIPVQRFVSQLI